MVWPPFIGGLVCLYLGFTFFGMWYISARSQHWTRLNGVVVSEYETVFRSTNEGDAYVSAGLKVDNHFPAVSVQVCLRNNLIKLHFPNPNHELSIGDAVIVCVHPLFPRLFYCAFKPEGKLSLLKIAGDFFVFMSALALLVGSVIAFSAAFGVYWF